MAIRTIGGDPDRIADGRRQPGSHHCYLELHIEQGGTLDRQRLPIGVVEGIVAIDASTATVTGFANHAGTTPMAERQDALVAASELAIAVREIVTRASRAARSAPSGTSRSRPTRANVIPGSAGSPSSCATCRPQKLDAIADAIRGAGRTIAAATKTSDRDRTAQHHSPPRSRRRGDAVRDRAGRPRRSTLSISRLPSGAGHDAQMMAQLGPMGMIFVPSVGGSATRRKS